MFITVAGQVPKQGVKTAVILSTDDPHYPKIPIPIWISNMHSSSIQRTSATAARHFSSWVLTACGKTPRSIRTGSPSVSSSLGRNSFCAVSRRLKSARVRRGNGARFICTRPSVRHPLPAAVAAARRHGIEVALAPFGSIGRHDQPHRLPAMHVARTNRPPACRHNCCTVSSPGNCRILSRLTFPSLSDFCRTGSGFIRSNGDRRTGRDDANRECRPQANRLPSGPGSNLRLRLG